MFDISINWMDSEFITRAKEFIEETYKEEYQPDWNDIDSIRIRISSEPIMLGKLAIGKAYKIYLVQYSRELFIGRFDF